MRSRPAISAEINETLEQEMVQDVPKTKHELTPARKASLERAREKAKQVRDQLKISNEKPKTLEEPESVKPVVESPIPLEEFDTKINTDTPKKSYIKKGKHFYISD